MISIHIRGIMWNTGCVERIEDTEQTNRTIGGDYSKWGFCFVTDWCKLHALVIGGCSGWWVDLATLQLSFILGVFNKRFCLFLFFTFIVYHHHHPPFASITIAIVIHIRWTNLLPFLFLYPVFHYHHFDLYTFCGRNWILWICCILHIMHNG